MGAPEGTTELPLQSIGSLFFRPVDSQKATEDVVALATSDSSAHVHLANAYTIALADREKYYQNMLNEGVNYADGKPITWFSKLFRQSPSIHQVRGPQLFFDVLEAGRASNVRHFFLGSSEATLQLLLARTTEMFPGVNIVGSYSPPYRQLTETEIAHQDDLLLSSEAQLIWVGLGTPKQDWEAERITKTLGLTTVAVGAAFDFAAGTVKPAPVLMQKLGLEWLFRFISEPKRLWRRYVFGNPRFIWAVLRHKGLRRTKR